MLAPAEGLMMEGACLQQTELMNSYNIGPGELNTVGLDVHSTGNGKFAFNFIRII